MQRKIILNTKYKLHSIPIIKMKSSVLYSIPCVAALLLMGIINLMAINYHCSATCGGDFCTGPISDTGTLTTPMLPDAPSATASLSLSTLKLTSNPTTPGSVATANTDVTVNITNASDYSLVLSVSDDTIINNGTTITAGNVVNDNTWGYKWDAESAYTAPSTIGTNLAVPDLVNGAANFKKTLTFGAKFSSNADAGEYKTSGTLSLIATPKKATATLANLTQMQQLSLVPDACANTPYLDGQTYSAEYTLTDVRDNLTYTVRKFGDGKCWMTSNLRLSNYNNKGIGFFHQGGRILKPATSDVESEWTLPGIYTLSSSDFSSSSADKAESYVASGGDIGYYTWCAATAGTCASATTVGQNAPSLICPKGWKLPTGGDTGDTDFYTLFKSMGLSISDSLNLSGSTGWGAGDLARVQGSPYNFNYTQNIINGAINYATSRGVWWSRTARSNIGAYFLQFEMSSVNPGTSNAHNNGEYYFGNTVRCIAE